MGRKVKDKNYTITGIDSIQFWCMIEPINRLYRRFDMLDKARKYIINRYGLLEYKLKGLDIVSGDRKDLSIVLGERYFNGRKQKNNNFMRWLNSEEKNLNFEEIEKGLYVITEKYEGKK